VPQLASDDKAQTEGILREILQKKCCTTLDEFYSGRNYFDANFF
jgi:hypothetical protein